MKKLVFLFSLLMSLTISLNSLYAVTVTDELTLSTTGVSGTSYTSWSGKTATSSAVYAGNSAGGNSSIQLRSTSSNSGVITTKSGGKIKSVAVEWNSNTANGRTLNVYGKNSAYSAATDLYNSNNQGTLIGTIVKGTSTSLTINDDYEYVGFRSASGAMYLDKVTIVWDKSSDVIVKTLKSIAVSDMTTTYEEGDRFSFDGICTATYSVTKNGIAQTDEKAVVTPTSISSPDMSTIGVKEVTITYTEDGVTKTANYNITVTEDVIIEGTYEIVPNNTFFATNAEGTISGAEANLTYTGKQNDITITYAKGSQSNMYINGSQTRTYNGSEMGFSVPNGYAITSISFTADGSNWTGTHTASLGTMTDNKNWSGNANSVTITFGGTCRITSISVTYAAIDLSAPATPTFSLESGSYLGTQSVEISCETADVSIYYTLDGVDPTSSSTPYVGAISISETKTLKAIAIKDNKSSSVASATYTITMPYSTIAEIYAAKTNSEKTVYITFGGWKISAIKNNQAFLTDGTNGLIIYQSNHGFNVGDVLTGTVECKLIAYYGSAELKELTSATDGLTVTSGTMSNPVVTTIDALSGVNTGSLVKIQNLIYDGTSLSDGTNSISIYTTLYTATLITGKSYNITGIYQQYNSTKQLLPRSEADIEELVVESVMTPIFSPAAGTYEGTQNVTITSTEGATIYYTTDGSEPTTNSSVYSSAIAVSASQTIKAFAVKSGLTDSEVSTAEYTIIAGPDVLLDLTDEGWNFPVNNAVNEQSFTNNGYTIKVAGSTGNGYKISGSYFIMGKSGAYIQLPKFDSPIDKIVVAGNSGGSTSVTWNIVKETTEVSTAATGCKNDAYTFNINNPETNVAYKILVTNAYNLQIKNIKIYFGVLPNVATPTFSVDAGTYSSVQSVEITCETEAAAIYYTTDGSTPTSSSTEYTTAISIEETTTIKAIAIKDGESSNVASATYTINLPILPDGCDGSDDFDSDESGTTATSYGDRSTTNGWTATYAQWTTIADEKCYFTINGKTTAVGVITSPVLSNGIASLKFNYAHMNAETNGINIKVEIKQGESVVKEYIITKTNTDVVKETVYTETIENIYIDGEFQIVITNLSPSNSTSNKDRVSIGKLCWTNFNPNYSDIRTDLSAGTWGTLCSAQQVDYPKGASFYTIAYVAMQGGVPTKVYFDEIAEGESLQAGQPYVFIANSDKIQGELTGDEVGAGLNDHGFIGKLEDFSFQVQDGDDSRDKYYVFYGNQIRRCADGYFKLLAGRAYLDVKDPNLVTKASAAPAPAPGRRRISMDNPEAPQQYTNVDASQVDGKPAKMFINGQLFILRDGQLYDTTGRIVK